jgi:dCTP deaminase
LSVLPSQRIEDLIRDGIITTGGYSNISPDQIQPASLDLRLGDTMFLVPGEFLPTKTTPMEVFLQEEARLVMSLKDGQIMEPGRTYVIPLQERLDDFSRSAKANPKSTTGRLGISTRLVANDHPFDTIESGHTGNLYLIVSTSVFEVIVHTGDTLHQIRFNDQETYDECTNVVQTLDVPIDLEGIGSNIVAYRANNHRSTFAGPIDLRKVKSYDRYIYWEEIAAPKNGRLLLSPEHFYVMASADKARVSTLRCGEMAPYNATLGEFRIHMAGFFDPGFGYGTMGEVDGAHSVFEIVPHAPTFITHGQTVAVLKMEAMSEMSSKVYGVQVSSNYQAQGLALAKHFI